MSDDDDRIEASLRRVFAPPDLSALQARLEAAAAHRDEATPIRPRARWIAAIGTAAAAVAVLLLVRRDDPAPVPPTITAEPIVPDAGRAIGLRLAQLHALGPALPRPDDADCLADPPLAESCTGQAPRLDPGDALEVLGECGAPGGPRCDPDDVPTTRLIHLRHRDGAELLVCIEPRHVDPHPSLPADAELAIFRRELGAFVAYEVTPLPEPHALDRLVP